MKKSKLIGVIISAIVIVVSVFAVVYNAVIVYNTDLKNIAYKNIEGTISVVQSSFVDGKSYYTAVYSFSIDNTSYSCNSELTDDVDKYKVGETAVIRYNPKSPSNCYVDNSKNLWNYLYLGISCVILIIAIKFFDKFFRAM